MSVEQNRQRLPAPDPGLVQDAHPLVPAGQEPDYRELERGYHQSADYAAMVERYPLLRSLIQSCRGSLLVGSSTALAPAHPPTVQLQWDRSHGEG